MKIITNPAMTGKKLTRPENRKSLSLFTMLLPISEPRIKNLALQPLGPGSGHRAAGDLMLLLELFHHMPVVGRG